MEDKDDDFFISSTSDFMIIISMFTIFLGLWKFIEILIFLFIFAYNLF